MGNTDTLIAFSLGCLVMAAIFLGCNNDSVLASEIANNEAVCQQERRPGYAVYVVSRHGELRGCIRVKQDSVNGVEPAPVMIVKHQPL